MAVLCVLINVWGDNNDNGSNKIRVDILIEIPRECSSLFEAGWTSIDNDQSAIVGIN